MKPEKISCGCQRCSMCKGTGKVSVILDIKTMKAEYIPCPACEGKDNFAKCYTHMGMFLDDEDRKRYESYQRRSV